VKVFPDVPGLGGEQVDGYAWIVGWRVRYSQEVLRRRVLEIRYISGDWECHAVRVFEWHDVESRQSSKHWTTHRGIRSGLWSSDCRRAARLGRFITSVDIWHEQDTTERQKSKRNQTFMISPHRPYFIISLPNQASYHAIDIPIAQPGIPSALNARHMTPCCQLLSHQRLTWNPLQSKPVPHSSLR